MDGAELDRILASASSGAQRIEWFGALLAKESGLGRRLVIVGGSAIEVYLSSDRYVSEDIDVVGDRRRIAPVLRRWGFEPEQGRDARTYWSKTGLGKVDLVGSADRAGLPSRMRGTKYGPVRLGPVEYLIVRRLMRSGREHDVELFRQAEALAVDYGPSLDWDYLRGQASYEGVLPLFERLREQVGPVSPRRK
jgi:hypothetical protein